MSTTTKTTKTPEEKVAEKDAKILQLQKQKKKILQQEKAKERKARNHRLYRRHGLLEMFMPDLIPITDDQFEAFIRTHINTNNGRNKLAELVSKGAEAATAYVEKCRAEEKAQAEAGQAEAQRNNGDSGGANQAQSAQSGA
ncbi:MAG: hypothetical protein FWF81_00765 [Defluviitaleaceae bacterium]|nr:hypothetical protein [Defluviitaleaceae bacterium]